jgi:uncharacterized membrane protein YkvA (DUF1232 family)
VNEPPKPAVQAGLRHFEAVQLLLAYLASPIDLVPDFIPVVGYADDAIIVAAVLRSVARRAGVQALERHWPGTRDGFAALCRLTRLTPDEASCPAGQSARADDSPAATT